MRKRIGQSINRIQEVKFLMTKNYMCEAERLKK